MTRPASAASVRGSAALLMGTILASGVDFGAQVLLVRALTRAEYGAWTYGLAVIFLIGSIARFEMHTAISRFLPTYVEQGRRSRIFPLIGIGLATAMILGVVLAGALIGLISSGAMTTIADEEVSALVPTLAMVIPALAIDGVITGVLASVGATKVIFLRQSILGPALRLGVVLLFINTGATTNDLATWYVVATLLGVFVTLSALYAIVRSEQLAIRSARAEWSAVAREAYTFAGPLMTSTIVWVVMESSDALFLALFFDAEAVAAFRVVLPLARMNMLVTGAFALLYLPMVSRLRALGDDEELTRVYWRTATWMMVLAAPIFYLCFAFSAPLTATVYGETYAASAPIMTVLAVGYFAHTVVGFNGLTLKAFGQVRFMVTADVAMAVVSVVISLALIPHLGPLGAAFASTATFLGHNLLKQYGLARLTPLPLFSLIYVRAYVSVAVAASALLAVQLVFRPSLALSVMITLAASIATIWVARRSLEVDLMFPELLRIPIVRRFVQS